MADGANWNSIEIAKLAVSALTPLTVALIGIGFARVTKRVEASQWVNQKLIEKRISLLGEALPQLNNLYCYFAWVGDWKELSPPEVLGLKRKLDRLFYSNSPFFSTETLARYEEFSMAIFKTHNEPGTDAQLRTGLMSAAGNRKTGYPKSWQQHWASSFTQEPDHTSRETVQDRYDALLSRLAEEIGVDQVHGRTTG